MPYLACTIYMLNFVTCEREWQSRKFLIISIYNRFDLVDLPRGVKIFYIFIYNHFFKEFLLVIYDEQKLVSYAICCNNLL